MLNCKILRKETLHKGKIFDLVHEKISYRRRIFDIEKVEHPGAVVIIPLLGKDTIIFVEQFRPALKSSILELPAGTLKKNESCEDAVKRELVEETGFTAKKIKEILKIYPAPGYTTELMHLFLAWDLRKGLQRLDKDELLKIKTLKIDEAFNLIKKRKIIDSKTIIGIIYLKFKIINFGVV